MKSYYFFSILLIGCSNTPKQNTYPQYPRIEFYFEEAKKVLKENNKEDYKITSTLSGPGVEKKCKHTDWIVIETVNPKDNSMTITICCDIKKCRL